MSLNKKYFWFYCAVLTPWTLGVVLSLVWFCSSVRWADGQPRGGSSSGQEQSDACLGKQEWIAAMCNPFQKTRNLS